MGNAEEKKRTVVVIDGDEEAEVVQHELDVGPKELQTFCEHLARYVFLSSEEGYSVSAGREEEAKKVTS